MNEIRKLTKQINLVKNKYDEIRKQKRLNIFSTLHKEHDEVYLHSRFISFLLSKDSGHSMQDIYAKIFVSEILDLNNIHFDLKNYHVIPNEFNKSEFKEIDILLINKKTRQAIIIENKINAPDSNKEGENIKGDGYDGQLERYYNTIKKGVDKDGKLIPEFQCDQVSVFYLTMYRNKKPSKASIGELKKVNVIYYDEHIRNWLEKCIAITPSENTYWKTTLSQYFNLINKMTHNDIPVEERNALRESIASDIESIKYLNDNFKHIRWHIVDEFWHKLKSKIELNFKDVELYPKENFQSIVTKITHNNLDENLGLTFKTAKGQTLYISSLGDLSWGMVNEEKWNNFKDESLQNIDFSSFSSKNTYQLIDNNNIENITTLILEEIILEKQNNFKSMKIK